MCLLITVVIVAVGIWPFSFRPVNKVERLQDGRGLRFYGPGIVYSREPLIIQGTAFASASVTIEILVRPHREIGNGVRSILTLSNSRQSEQIVIGQWIRELILRVPAGKGENANHYREISVDNALPKDMTSLITITSTQEKTDIYINGRRQGHFPRYSLITDDSGLSGRLLLGNSPDGNNYWYGIVTGLALYDRPLDSNDIQVHYKAWQQPEPLFSANDKPIALYLFDGLDAIRIEDHSGSRNDLIRPVSFRPFRRLVLVTPGKDQLISRWNLLDIAVNILGFVPFGFFLAAWLSEVKNLAAPNAFGITLFGSSCLSLAIELTQAYIPGRDSSLLDVISNTLGAAIGVFLVQYALPVLHRFKGDRAS